MLQSQVIGNLGADAAVEKDNADRQYVCFSMAHKEFGKDHNADDGKDGLATDKVVRLYGKDACLSEERDKSFREWTYVRESIPG